MTFPEIIPGLLAGKKYTYSTDGYWWIQFGEEDDLGGRILRSMTIETSDYFCNFWAHWLTHNDWWEVIK
jgi:hypothetical protein